MRNCHAHFPASPFHGVKCSLRRRRDFLNRQVTTSGRRRKRLSGLRSGVLVIAERPPGLRRGPPEVVRRLLGVRVADLRDEEGPWPATGPESSSGSAATARSPAGGCDGEGRVGVRGQRSGCREVLLDCGWGMGLGRGAWTPRRPGLGESWLQETPGRCEGLWRWESSVGMRDLGSDSGRN